MRINLLGIEPGSHRDVITRRLAGASVKPQQIEIIYGDGDVSGIKAAFSGTKYEAMLHIGPSEGLIYNVAIFLLDPVEACTIYGTEEAPLFYWLREDGVPHGWALGMGIGLFVPRSSLPWFLATYKHRIDAEIMTLKDATVSWEDED